MTSAVLLVAGLATPLAAAIAASTMLVAALSLTMVSKTLWIAAGGGEYPAVLAASAVVAAFTGPGRYSLDFLLGTYELIDFSAAVVGTAVLFVALIGAVPPIVSTRRTLASKG